MKKHYYRMWLEEEYKVLRIESLFMHRDGIRKCICGREDIVAGEASVQMPFIFYCIDCAKRRLLKAKMMNFGIRADRYAQRHLLRG